jgi:hypothetical protein
MGASQWSQFGPYHKDITTCFVLLCGKVFSEQDYKNLWKPEENIRQEIETNIDDEITLFGIERCLAITQQVAGSRMAIHTRNDMIVFNMMHQSLLETPPATIEALLKYNGPSGTHSILDYAHDGSYGMLPPAIAAQYLKPISQAILIRVFDTPQPTHEQIVRRKDHLWKVLLEEEKHSGKYCVVYRAGEPTEIFVMGISGD